MTRICAVAVTALALGFLPADGLLGQEQQRPGAAGPTAAADGELVFEREVFDYPTFERRNPFVRLLSTADGPRFEQMRLRGIIYRPDGESVAILGGGGAGSRGERLRVGEAWGNVRVLEIRRTEVLVEVEEFGLTEQHVMTLPTRGQGGS